MAAGDDAAIDAARYVTFGIALLTVIGIFSAGITSKK
ncbi:hypothetical protein ACI0FR_02386 [Paenochrobactrum sp. BZR 201-1]